MFNLKQQHKIGFYSRTIHPQCAFNATFPHYDFMNFMSCSVTSVYFFYVLTALRNYFYTCFVPREKTDGYH